MEVKYRDTVATALLWRNKKVGDNVIKLVTKE